MGTSFCHVLTHAGEQYVYDVGTNRLLQIDPVLADVLPLWRGFDADEDVQQLGDRHAPSLIHAAMAEIATARQDEQLFCSERPQPKPLCDHCFDPASYFSRLSLLALTVTEQCNLRCHYCLHDTPRNWVRPHRNHNMSLATALAALHYFAEHCRDTTAPIISFYGGEPLLRFDLIQAVVTEIRSHPDWPSFHLTVDTNGTLLTGEIIEFLVREKIHLQISLDGPLELHDRYRVDKRSRGSHARVLAGIEQLLRLDPEAADRLFLVATLTPPFDLPAVMDYFTHFPPFASAGIATPPEARINFADLEGVDPDRVPQSPEAAAELRQQLNVLWRRYRDACVTDRRAELPPAMRSLFDRRLIRIHRRARSPLPVTVSPHGCCQPGLRRLHVKSDGTLQPCERLGETMTIGHVKTGIDLASVESLYAGMFQACRERCANCWAVRLCHLCFTVLAPTWDPDNPEACRLPESVCDTVRRELEDDFRRYIQLLAHGADSVAFLDEITMS
ncbi:MAG: radical SAM protein [bacterium]